MRDGDRHRHTFSMLLCCTLLPHQLLINNSLLNLPTENSSTDTVLLTESEKLILNYNKCVFARFTEKPVVGVVPDRRVFSGETVTLTCDIQQTGDWAVQLVKDNNNTFTADRSI